MRKFMLFYALIIFLFNFFPLNSKANLICEESESLLLGGTSYPYNPNGETITVKFIFVAFDGDSAGQVITLDDHQEAVNGMISYINESSHGQLILSPDSGIILRPDVELNEANPIADSWVAQLPARDYRSGSCDSCITMDQDYLDFWAAEPRGVADWYVNMGTNKSNRASELLAEIFWTIKNEYEQYPELPGPFDDEIGAIIVIFQSITSPDPTAGGRPHITLDVSAINADTDYFSNIKVVNNEFAGTVSRQASARPVTDIFDAEKCKMAALHEFVHTLGLGDGPPSFSAMEISCGHANLCENRYYFGNQNLMSQHYVIGFGVPPIGLSVLEYLPWYSEENGGVVDFTGANKYNEKIYDIRSEYGKIYKFKVGNYLEVGEEDFVIAYHSGMGVIDSQSGVNGGPVLPSLGLEIWHRVGERMHDLESAVGNWKFGTSGRDSFIFPTDIGVPEDRLNGYDNHDVWNIIGEVARASRKYEIYKGEEYDYFRIDLGNTDYNKDEFSFRSNPRSFGYSKSENTHEFLRRRPQDVANSLVVKLHGTGTDSHGKYMLVDLLSAPGGVVLSPTCYSGPASYYLGNKIHIAWDHDEYDEAAESVDILFSKFGGEHYQETLIENLPVGGGEGSWDWFPSAEHGTNHGRIKVVFNNSNSDHSNSAESPCQFIISTPMVVEEYIVFPNGGEIFTAGPTSVIPVTWTNLIANIPGENIDSVDLYYSIDDGVNWPTFESDITSSINFSVDPETGNNVFNFAIADSMVSEHARVKLVFHSGANSEEDISESPFIVFPVEAVFSNVSNGAGVTYKGQPYNAISLDYDSDNRLDLLISMQEVEGGVLPKSELFRNTSNLRGEIKFVNRTQFDFGPSGPPLLNSNGLSAGDFDNDGWIDFFVTHKTAPRLYHNSNGVFINSTNDSSVVNPLILPLIQNSSCAVWVDYDHDSDLDLYVGCAGDVNSSGSTPEQDYVLINNGLGGLAGAFTIGSSAGNTSSAVWADFNEDGLWEVIVGDFQSGPGGEITMYVEIGSPTRAFVEVPGAFPSGFNRSGVASLHWTDYDRDGDLDLFVKRQLGGTEILVNNHGSLTEVVTINNDQDWNSTAAIPFDYNLDGWPDFLLSDPTSDPQIRLIANFQGNSSFVENDFADITKAVGFAGLTGPARGVLPCDFNKDGDLDLFLGTTQTESSGNAWLLRNSNKDGQEDPRHNYLPVEVASSPGNMVSLGAIVKLETPFGEPLGTQIVDGGSGIGGQMPNILVFGLGDYEGPVNTIVNWPSGRTTIQAIDSASVSYGSVVTITAEDDLDVIDSSIKRSIIFDPVTLSLRWTITWNSDHWSERALDKVTIIRVAGQNCGPNSITLQAGDPDVTVHAPDHFVDPATGVVVFRHKVEWVEQPCNQNCRYSIEVESSNGVNTDFGVSPKDATFKTCPSGTPQGGQ